MVPAEFRIGNLEHYKEGDEPIFTNYDEAIARAILLSYTDSLIGVWIGPEDDMDLLAIVYQQRIFTLPD